MDVSCGRPRWLWLLIAAATVGGGRAALAARVAVVTDGGAAVEQVIDLAQAKMASDVKSQAQFVERASIKKIFAEQKLSLSGVVDAGEAVKVGQLLGAEFLAVVETDDAHANATGVVLFDARTGERFEDDGLGGADEKTADALADSLRAGLRKAALPMKKRRPICLLTVRNVNLPKSQDAFCGAIARLVERRLLGSPDVVVLERERLNEVRKEEALHPGSGEKSELIASVVMMELQLERDNGQIRATCVLSDSMGKRVGAPMSTAEAGRGAEGVAEELAAMIGTALKVTAAPSADDPAARKAEALRFYHEARFWWTHHEYDRPVESMEAAAALDPENPLLQAQLARALTLSGIARIGHFNDRAAETGRDVMIFIEPGVKPAAVSESLGLVEAGMQCVLAEGNISSTVESAQVTSTTRALGMAYLAGIESVQVRPGMGQPGMEPPLTTEDQFATVRAIRRDYCTLLRRDVEAPAIEDVTDWKSAVQATSGLQAILMDPAFYNTAPRGEVIADLKELTGAWKNMWAAHPPKGSPSVKAVLQMLDPKHLGPTLEQVTPFAMGRGRLSEADRESLLPVYESLAQINDPACAATAALGIAWATPPGGKRTGGSIPSQWLGAGSFRTPTELKPARGGTAVVAAPAGPDWAKKLLLLDVGTKTGNEERKISRPIAHGKYVYAVETMRMGRDVQYKLLKIDPLQPADVQPAGIPAETRGRPGPAVFQAAPDCIAGGYYILVGKPSVLFSLSGKGGIMLNADRGFDFRAGKVTVVDGKAFASDDGSQGMLVEYDIDAETMKTLAASKRTDVQSPFDNLPPMKIPMLLPDAARHRIVFFATGGGVAQNAAGALSAQHLVTLGGQLYAAIDHSYSPSPTAALSHIDPASGKIETLIATTLVQSESGPKHYPIVRGLWADAARDRLLYLAQGAKPDPAADGIWEWKLAAHQKRLLLPLYISDGKNDPLGSSEIVWTGCTADGHPLVASRRGLFEFDPANDRAKAIMQGATLLDPLAPTAITLTGRTVPQAANDLLSGRISTEMPYAVADGFLWFSNGRCSLDGKIFEQFPHLRSGRDFLPDEIQFIDGGAHCLVSDEYGAWLLDIKK